MLLFSLSRQDFSDCLSFVRAHTYYSRIPSHLMLRASTKNRSFAA